MAKETIHPVPIDFPVVRNFFCSSVYSLLPQTSLSNSFLIRFQYDLLLSESQETPPNRAVCIGPFDVIHNSAAFSMPYAETNFSIIFL